MEELHVGGHGFSSTGSTQPPSDLGASKDPNTRPGGHDCTFPESTMLDDQPHRKDAARSSVFSESSLKKGVAS